MRETAPPRSRRLRATHRCQRDTANLRRFAWKPPLLPREHQSRRAAKINGRSRSIACRMRPGGREWKVVIGRPEVQVGSFGIDGLEHLDVLEMGIKEPGQVGRRLKLDFVVDELRLAGACLDERVAGNGAVWS